MVSGENLLIYLYCKIPFILHTNASDKNLGDPISHNFKPIAFFSRRLIKPHHNNTTIKKELIAIVVCLKKFREILFGYEINLFSYHKIWSMT